MGLDVVAGHGETARRAVAGLVVVSSAAILWHGWLVPPQVNPADFYLRAYSDEPTKQAFRDFVEREPVRQTVWASPDAVRGSGLERRQVAAGIG